MTDLPFDRFDAKERMALALPRGRPPEQGRPEIRLSTHIVASAFHQLQVSGVRMSCMARIECIFPGGSMDHVGKNKKKKNKKNWAQDMKRFESSKR